MPACWKYDAKPATENELGNIVNVVEPTLGVGAPTDEDACSALAARALPDATITEARVIAAGQYSMPQNMMVSVLHRQP